MPLGWGRTIGSYVGSHLGSFGRPPTTKKAIVHIYNNEHGISPSTQLQPYSFDDGKSISTSTETNSEIKQQNSSQNEYNEDNTQKKNYKTKTKTTNISDGVVEHNYARSIQLGALLAVCYNLFSAHLRLRSLQSQKPILTGNTKSRQLLVVERQIPALQYTVNGQDYKGKPTFFVM